MPQNYLSPQAYQSLQRERLERAVRRTRLSSLQNAVRLNLPVLYDLQQEIKDHPAKRKVVAAGRRAGKTETTATIGIETFLGGGKALLTSTSQDQADIFWKRILKWMQPILDDVYTNQTKRLITLGDASIKVKTGRAPDMLRGEDADLLVLDECANLDPAAWFEVGAPMLTDRNGVAIFISTPKRRNWFYHLYMRALEDTTGRWKQWNFPSHANPHLSAEALAELAADMTQDAYKQEILAEFLESGGEVFRLAPERLQVTPQNAAIEGHRYVMGVDLAKQQDYTFLTVIDTTTRPYEAVAVDRFQKQDWPLQVARIQAMVSRFDIRTVTVDQTGVGDPIVGQLQREAVGYTVNGFIFTGSSKPQLIESLALALERGDLNIINDGVLVGELSAYERKVSPTTGHSQYSAPEGLHDDGVISLALALRAAQYGGVLFGFV